MTRKLMQLAWLGAGLAGASVAGPAPAHAQYYGYGYYGYRPYYVPFYQPRVLFAPPPVYLAPPVQPYVVAPVVSPRPVLRHRAARVRVPAARPVEPSPFGGPGVEVVVPAAAAPAPFVAPLPGRIRPGAGDLPRSPAPVPPAAATAPPPINVFPPESPGGGFRGD